MGLDRESDELHLSDLAKTLARAVSDKKKASKETASKTKDQDLPRFITFPYSRHSSYAELCHLVRMFNPRDVYPCTVDEKNWHEGEPHLPFVDSRIETLRDLLLIVVRFLSHHFQILKSNIITQDSA